MEIFDHAITEQQPQKDRIATSAQYDWIANVNLFLGHINIFFRVGVSVFILAVVLAFFILPKEYESSARIMPPEQSNGSLAMLAALAGKGSGGGATSGGGSLAGLAGSLLGAKSNGALFVALLRSGTVSGNLVNRFDLMHVYHTRYRSTTAKRLFHATTITEDAKSGVITIVVKDKSPERARDLAQGYLDELNHLVAKVNTSSAHREREFIEQRLKTVQNELQQSQIELSDFSTKTTTVDVKEQTHAMVDVGAKLQAQLILGQSDLNSLRQVYGNENVRVKAAEARNSVLQREIQRESGLGEEKSDIDDSHPYPSLRQLPQLGVRWTNLYRTVHIHEAVFELLSEQYELARIEEAKSIPTIGVIDAPGVPERKSGPHRMLIVFILTVLSMLVTGVYLLMRRSWLALDSQDDRRLLVIRLLNLLPVHFRPV